MLSQINISNFALIENLTVDFYEGLNLLSGETGAGKSILIDAINYVLGSKFNKDLIRYGEDKTYVEAIFSIDSDEIKNNIKEFIEEDDEFIIINRETFQNGKSLAKINGRAVTVSSLKKVSSFLIDIHGQHDNQKLLYKKNHISYLDNFGNEDHFITIKKYEEKYDELNKVLNIKKELLSKYGDKDKILEYIKFRIEEIEKMSLKYGEEEELNDKVNLLQNSEMISENISQCFKLLYESEESNSIYDSLKQCINSLRAVENNLKDLVDYRIIIEDFYFKIEDITYNLRKHMENIYYDEKELNTINNRLYKIQNLKKKYGNSVEEIILYKDKLKKEQEELSDFNSNIEKLDNQIISLEKELILFGEEIHSKRLYLGEILQRRICEELKYIGMENSRIEISITQTSDFFKNGMDIVEFLISTNKGEPLKELEKIVSGGELSRVMLGIKTVFADKDNIPSLIFDEIDNGISGKIAQCVGEKLSNISSKHQVFCITHLPQIAAFSDNHYKIEKFTQNEKTYTKIQKLSKEEKEIEIARMLGGKEITKITLDNAKEMIEIAKKI